MAEIIWVVTLQWGGDVELMAAYDNETDAQEHLEYRYNLLDYPKSAFSIHATKMVE